MVAEARKPSREVAWTWRPPLAILLHEGPAKPASASRAVMPVADRWRGGETGRSPSSPSGATALGTYSTLKRLLCPLIPPLVTVIRLFGEANEKVAEVVLTPLLKAAGAAGESPPLRLDQVAVPL